jgi:NADH:ubiquinone reductase (H+-translocating)
LEGVLLLRELTSEGVKIGEEDIPAKTVIWTAGVKASPAGQWLGAEIDHHGRVKVEPDLTMPGHPNVFVIGDKVLLKRRPGDTKRREREEL